ncbi:MAG: amidohydrolase family protein [Bacteroidota bacterium]
MLDFLIVNAKVCTGRKEPAQVKPVGIKDQQIVLFEENSARPAARQVIDGEGLLLAPGFIDPHASTGFGYFFPEAANHKLYQGITTEIFGNCGTSPAPIGDHLVATMERLSKEIEFPFNWRSLSEYFEAIQDKLQFNIATLVGHSTLRGGYMDDWKNLQPQQLEEMKSALAQAMDEGAIGFSTGLIYAPGCFAEMEEIIELARVTAEKGGVYASHIRDERNKIEEAVAEALTISEATGIRTLISHLKAAEQQNWGKIPGILRRIEAFNQRHPEMPAAVDVYPYTAISTKLRAFIPKYILKEGIAQVPEKLKNPKVRQDIADWIETRGYDLTQMMIISDEFEEYYGKDVQQIAREQGLSESETIAQILSRSTETWIVYHCINQEDIDAAVLWDQAMICTDSWSYPINAPKSIGQPHPRSYGAFTCYLERYVKELQALSWEEAIHKITYLPAQFFGLKDRGQIAENYFADLVLINPATLKANASYTAPRQLSDGIEYLWVNGRMVIENREVKPAMPGQILSLNRHEKQPQAKEYQH